MTLPSKETIARYATMPPPSALAAPRAPYPSELPEARKARRLKWKLKQPVTANATRYGKVGIKLKIAARMENDGISESAARMRHYREMSKNKKIKAIT